jgi:dipeptidase E
MTLQSVHEVADAPHAVDRAHAVFIGGGNTFRLLKALYDYDLLVPVRRKVAEGTPYIGSSAGSNVSCPTIKTTKDMPIVEPPSFDALGLVSFQISPHYQDPDPSSTHMGETQEERIIQFLEENATPVVGLREGAMLETADYHSLSTFRCSGRPRVTPLTKWLRSVSAIGTGLLLRA